jgi:glycine cleavage system H protein
VAERLYSETHEWLTTEGRTATVGITDFAQAQLGDVVFLELPKKDTELEAGASFGVIESVKAASDLYSPAAGRVVEVNERLTDSPELVNRDPYGEGWLIKVELSGAVPSKLLDEAAYKQLTEKS